MVHNFCTTVSKTKHVFKNYKQTELVTSIFAPILNLTLKGAAFCQSCSTCPKRLFLRVCFMDDDLCPSRFQNIFKYIFAGYLKFKQQTASPCSARQTTQDDHSLNEDTDFHTYSLSVWSLWDSKLYLKYSTKHSIGLS